MKTIFGLLFIFVSLCAFAGPEEHIANQTCYVMAPDQVYIPWQHVPQEICLEEISLNTDTSTIHTFSYFTPEFFRGLQLIWLARKNEDFYNFKASNVVFNQSAPCDDSERVEMLISGLSDNYGSIDIRELNVSVRQEYTNDSCHSSPDIKVITYILK